MSPDERNRRASELLRHAGQLRREAKLAERQARRLRERQPGDGWYYLGLTPPETMSDHAAYASWVLAHIPALAEPVIDGRLPLLVAVESVLARVDCPFPCEHRPLSTAERADLVHRMIESASS